MSCPRGGALAIALLAACAAEAPPPERVQLEGEVVARVGDEVITRDAVAAIARAQNVDAERALELATFDALTAAEARARKLDVRHDRSANAALARLVIDALADESRAEGPPTEEEIAALTERHWVEVARPEGVVVAHAVVMVPPGASPDVDASALGLAKRVREALAPASELAKETPAPDNEPKRGKKPPGDPAASELVRLAQSVAAGDLQVIAEHLWPIGSDALTLRVEAREQYDPLFVAGAFALKDRGDLSQPVRSSFGYHVILLLDRIPAATLTFEQRQKRFEPEVTAVRTRRKLDELLTRLRTEVPVNQDDPNVGGLLEQVQLEK
jgi:peptidyl-prolyl cis-trans isomerase C